MNNEQDYLCNAPAFPSTEHKFTGDGCHDWVTEFGMSKRAYAAIHLKVADSGEEWLDDMIRKANRRDDLRSAIVGVLSGELSTPSDEAIEVADVIAEHLNLIST